MTAVHEATPPGDTGVVFRPDWLSLTVFAGRETVQEWAEALIRPTGAEWERRPGRQWFNRADVLLGAGVRVLSEPDERASVPVTYCSLQIEGTAWAELDVERFREWAIALDKSGLRWQVTRLDLAWNGVPFTPHQVLEAVDAGNVRSPAQRNTAEWQSHLTGIPGATLYWGSRSSERLVRVYDKRGPTRLELEVKGERARAVFAELLNAETTEWATRSMRHLRDFLDIVDGSSTKDISARPLLPWWAEFTGGEVKAGLRLTRVMPSLLRAVTWVQRQVAPTLAALELACEPGFVESVLMAGAARIGPRQRVLVAEARAT